MTIAALADVLPGTVAVEAFGAIDGDGVHTVRTQRVLDATGAVLFDIDSGHPRREVEDAVDAVNVEYLDELARVLGDMYLGQTVIQA